MAKLVYGLSQSLDGFIASPTGDLVFAEPDPALFHHFYEWVRDVSAGVYGRRMYEVMAYWDEDQPDWTPEQRDFAAAWRRQPKWVASRTLKSVGPNATLVAEDVETVVAGLKARLDGEIEIAGAELAHSLAHLVDEYRLYFRPVVLGAGLPFFAGPRPPLRFVSSQRIAADTVRLTYVPA